MKYKCKILICFFYFVFSLGVLVAENSNMDLTITQSDIRLEKDSEVGYHFS